MSRMSPRSAATAALVLLAAVVVAGPAAAQSYRNMDCDELWYARNEIYAEKGFCFKTAAAIEVFGRNCFPPYGKLTRAEQREVDQIATWERRKGC